MDYPRQSIDGAASASTPSRTANTSRRTSVSLTDVACVLPFAPSSDAAAAAIAAPTVMRRISGLSPKGTPQRRHQHQQQHQQHRGTFHACVAPGMRDDGTCYDGGMGSRASTERQSQPPPPKYQCQNVHLFGPAAAASVAAAAAAVGSCVPPGRRERERHWRRRSSFGNGGGGFGEMGGFAFGGGGLSHADENSAHLRMHHHADPTARLFDGSGGADDDAAGVTCRNRSGGSGLLVGPFATQQSTATMLFSEATPTRQASWERTSTMQTGHGCAAAAAGSAAAAGTTFSMDLSPNELPMYAAPPPQQPPQSHQAVTTPPPRARRNTASLSYSVEFNPPGGAGRAPPPPPLPPAAAYILTEPCTPQPRRCVEELLARISLQIDTSESYDRRVDVIVQSEGATPIFSWLRVGGAPTASMTTDLLENNFTYFANCAAKDVQCTATATHPRITTLRIEAEDRDDSYILTNHYEAFRAFADRARRAGAGLYVHCRAGVNRSPTLVLAYLVDRLHMTLPDAIRLLRERGRSRLLHNRSFRRQLADFALNCNENQTLTHPAH